MEDHRDFLKGFVSDYFWGYFAFSFRDNITTRLYEKRKDYSEILKIGSLLGLK